MQFVDFFAGFVEGFPAARGDLVDAAATPGYNVCRGFEESALFETVQQRVQGSGTDPIAVVGEFFHHRKAEDGLMRGMYQDVDSDEPEIEFALFS